VQRHQTINLFQSLHTQFGLDRTYHLPEIKIDDDLLVPQVMCRNDRVGAVYFDMQGACYYPSDPQCTMSQLLNRSGIIRTVLTINLGQPKRYNPHCFGFLDEKLSLEEIDALQAWEYDFEWGGAQTCCFFEQGNIVTMGLSVGYHPS
jgi:hypothetical protein